MSSNEPFLIDGSVLEGGGQVLRNAIALSALLEKNVIVEKIRAGRNNPGLHAQHLTGLELVQQICNANLVGGAIKSSRIEFHPKALAAGSFVGDTETAGSICLLIQIAMPCLLFAPGPTTVTLRGGTNADFAPQIDYFQRVFMPIAGKAFKLPVQFDVVRRGYYPKGKGEVLMRVIPVSSIPPIRLINKGQVTKINMWSFVAGELPLKIATRTATAALQILKKQFPESIIAEPIIVAEPPHKAVGAGSGIMIWLETDTGCVLAGSAIGSKGKQAEVVGREAADQLMSNHRHGGCVDEFLQDQLIIFMALAEGESQVLSGPISLHTKTAVHIMELLTTAKFQITKFSENEQDERQLITCQGIGYHNSTDVKSFASQAKELLDAVTISSNLTTSDTNASSSRS